MIRGESIALRPVREDELPLIYASRQDPDAVAMVDNRPYRPVTFAAWTAARGPQEDSDVFAIQEGVEDGGPMIGGCSLWGIDLHNRSAHVGMGLYDPASRGRGYGLQALRLVVDYGFRHRGLHRLQLETLEHNTPMRRCALAAGFTQEGELRSSGWVGGGFANEIVYGLLRTDRTRDRGAGLSFDVSLDPVAGESQGGAP